MLPVRHAQKLNPEMNVELIVGQKVFEQHAEESRATAARKCKDPVAYGTPGLTPCPYIERVPVSQGSPPRALILRTSLENVHIQNMPSVKTEFKGRGK